jgi:hypothetical protein
MPRGRPKGSKNRPKSIPSTPTPTNSADAPVAFDRTITNRKILDVRSATDLHQFIPADANEFREDFLDILSRMDCGYWPATNIGRGWYGLIALLNQELREHCYDYRILNIKRENGALHYSIRVPLKDENRLPHMVGLIRVTAGRSRCVCEICGRNGDEAIVNHEIRVLCNAHIPVGTVKYG